MSLGSETATETGAIAITLLDDCLGISGELGMRPMLERVLWRREILGRRISPSHCSAELVLG